MATLPELPTSEVIELARSYLSGWGGIPLPDDIASEALNRLDIALAAVRQAMKERDELQRKLDAVAKQLNTDK